MRNTHIRILVILAIITLLGSISTQIYWLNRAIDQQDQVFNHNVHVALRNVVESLCQVNGKDYPSINPIEQLSENYYIVRTNDRIDLANLEYLITAEIRKRAITQDFDYGVYDCQSDQMVFAENVDLSSNRKKSSLPHLENEEYYFGVYFPYKSQSIIAGLDLWKFTTILTLIVVIFFGYALFVILQQKRLSEIQKDFINNVTHELKTPLSTLTLASNTLSERVGTSGGKYIQIIESEVSRLKTSVESILQASLFEGNPTITKESVNVYELAESLLKEFEQHYAHKMICWNLTGSAPSAIFSNRSTIEKAIRNLVENAVKYGGRNIALVLKQDNKRTSISVSDNGIGIPERYRKRIFSKFFRIPDKLNQHNTKGFGLGLYIVKSSLKRIKGSISVVSEFGKGSTFMIILLNG
ncbi:MAG: HAMP domain-containing sensor histidine kinase [Bacteroidota bacterium]